MNYEEIIRDRFACRKFDPNKPVSDELLNKILEAGRVAPSAKNYQPTRVYVIKSEEGLKKLDYCTPCRYDAPLALLVCGDKDVAYSEGKYSSYEMDASIFTTQMMLEAVNLDLNNVWIKKFVPEELQKEYDIPKNIVPVCILLVGYKSEDCPPSPNRFNRKSIDEIVSYR